MITNLFINSLNLKIMALTEPSGGGGNATGGRTTGGGNRTAANFLARTRAARAVGRAETALKGARGVRAKARATRILAAARAKAKAVPRRRSRA